MMNICGCISLFWMLAIAMLFGQTTVVRAQNTCSELVNGEPSDEAGKRNAQLCQLVELADVLDGMSKVLGEGLTSVLNGLGVTVDETDGADGDKHKNEYVRFGKRKNEFLRYGKRKNEFLRYGKRKNEFLRYG